MNRVVAKLKTFFGAEEVPRWIGLTLILLYMASLGAVGYASHQKFAKFARSYDIRSNEEAVQLLAEVLETSSSDTLGRSQDVLRRFARRHDCIELRVYNRDQQVIAAMTAQEIGGPVRVRDGVPPSTPTSLESRVLANPVGGSDDLLVLRAPIHTVGGPPVHFIEGVMELKPPIMLGGALQLWALVAVLVCTGAFLMTYRFLRRHFRSFSEIADNLLNSADDLEQELHELRICDANDTVSATWNKLIDLTSALKEEVARSAASNELVQALSKTKGGELAEAMNTASLGIILVSEQRGVLYANAMASRLCGLNRDSESAPTLDDENLSDEGRRIAEQVNTCVDGQGAFRTTDTQIESADGSFYQIQVRPVRTQQSVDRWAVLVLDVSQQVRADRAREEFVSQVTHELRTPLTNIRAYAETLSSGMFDDPKVITECYNVITKETRRLSRLIEDILSISQLEVGTMQLVFDDVDLRSLLTDAVRDVRGIAESKETDLQVVLPAKLEPIHADRDKLAVVVNNLLGNALKYTLPGGQVVLSCKASEDDVLISVKDSGIGIDAEDHERIFEKFQRSQDEDVQNETGTGIGLTTAREIARRHGGDITLMSKKGEGSTFTARIPRGSASAKGAGGSVASTVKA